MNCYRRPWHVVQQSINITDLSGTQYNLTFYFSSLIFADDTAAIEIHETYTAPYSTLVRNCQNIEMQFAYIVLV